MFDNFVTSFSPLSSCIWISISLYVAKFSLSFTWSSVLFDMLYIFLLQEHKSAKTVGEMKQYVQRIPFMQRAKSSLATRKEFKRMTLAFLFISFTSRDTPFLSKHYITYFEDHSYSVKSQRKRTKTSASDFVLLQWMAQLFPPFSCVVWISSDDFPVQARRFKLRKLHNWKTSFTSRQYAKAAGKRVHHSPFKGGFPLLRNFYVPSHKWNRGNV